MKQEERPDIRYIPENYATGINFAGMNFRLRNFIEGIITALLAGVLSVIVFFEIPFLDFGTRIGFIISFALMGLVLGIIGINDEPLSVFIANRLAFRKRQRTAFYNPRIKDETIPYVYEYQSAREALPREKIIAFYRRYKSDLEKKEQERMLEFQKTNTFDETSMFFKDDEGIIDKPVDYMNPSEYRRYLKDLKRRKRKEKKEERRRLKEEKRLKRKGIS